MSAIRAYYSAVAGFETSLSEHLPSIEWLVSVSNGVRRSGRTRVLAAAFLKAAATSSGATVKAFDHQRSGPNGGLNNIIAALREMAPGVQVMTDGTIDPQPAYAEDPRHPQSGKIAISLIGEFSSLCAACLRHGVPVEWMLDVVKKSIVRSVMES